jgi:hypothetical protein
MALSLDQIKSKKKLNTSSTEVEKPKAQRPWVMEHKTNKSFSGHHAVRKAQEIVEKNNEMVLKLRDEYINSEAVLKADQYIAGRNEVFENLESSQENAQKIKVPSSLFNRVKRALFGI